MSVPIGIREDLRRDESVRLVLYDDATGKPLRPGDTLQGNATIGTGRNLSGFGITELENDLLLDHDIAGAARELDIHAPWWSGLSENRRRGLLNMSFNLGWPRLAGFARMLEALKAGDGEGAAAEALASRWAAQVGERATRIAELFRKG